MKKVLLVLFMLLTFQIFSNPYNYSRNSQDYEPIKELVKNDILKWINNPIIIKAVKEANAKNKDRDEAKIIAQNLRWISGDSAFQGLYINNPTSNYLLKIKEESDNIYAEIFVMDFQGCNVALSDLTSDFWQGDEDKFKKSFNGGVGSVYIDEIKRDESTTRYQVQVSLPIVDMTNAEVIGAITIGIDVGRL